MTNLVKYTIAESMMPTVELFIVGGFMQTFLSEAGVSLKYISIYATIVSLVQIAIKLVNIYAADRFKNVLRTQHFMSLGPIVTCICMLPFCFIGSAAPSLVFTVAAVTAVITNIFLGFHEVLNFRLIYIIADKNEYAKVINVKGVFRGLLSITVGLIISIATTRMNYHTVMGGGLILCALFCICSSTLIGSLKPISSPDTAVTAEKQFSPSVLMRREFKYFYIPNILRGMGSGIMSVMSVICIKNISDDAAVVSGMVNVLSASAIIGCMCYRLIDKHISSGPVYTVTCAAMFVLLPMMVMSKSVTVFYILYFLLGVCYNINNGSAAVYPTEIVPYRHIGTFTSVRLMCLMLGQSISTYCIGLAIDEVPSWIILAACGFFQLLSGIGYALYRPAPESEAQQNV